MFKSTNLKNTFVFLLLAFPFLGSAQLADLLNAEYLIVNKSTNTSGIDADRGFIIFDNSKAELNINSREESRKERINTSNYTIGLTSAGGVELKSFQYFNEVGIYNYILSPSQMDFGLGKLGFTSQFMDKDEDGIFIEWIPNSTYKTIISKVLTKIHNDRMDRIEYFGPDDELLCEVIFENWGEGDQSNIPVKIKSRYHIGGVTYDRMIKLSAIRMMEL